MKTIIKIFITIAILFTFWSWVSYAENYDQKVNSDNGATQNNVKNDYLNNSKSNNHIWEWNKGWVKWISYLMMNIAQSLKNIFIAIASIYFLIIVIKLLFTEWSSDEEFNKFKQWLIWITIWIIVMQIAYSYVSTIYNQKIGADIAEWLIQNIVEPLLKLLEFAAALFFIIIAIFAFYKILTSNWDEEKAKSWKKSFGFAIIGYLVLIISKYFVEAVYSKTLCETDWVINCINEKSLSDWAKTIFDIINWTNWFVWIVVVLMIIYTWAQIIFSNGDDEKIKKAKKSIIYIIIWITLLVINYLILTFFLVEKLT